MKPKVYQEMLGGRLVEVANQCGAHLPFHHEDYVVSDCGLREGHEGQHQCPTCQRLFQVRAD